MAEPAVSYTVEDDIAVIVLERAAARNAINIDILRGLEAAWRRFNEADERVAVLAARGEHFSVGLDLKDPPPDMWRCVPGVGVDVAKPIVAAASGWCVGGGLILVQMSDLCVAAESTKFLYPEAKVGVTAGLIAGLAARIPVKIAMELMLLGEPIDAERAYSVGLINRVVPDGEHIEAAKTMPTPSPAMRRWSPRRSRNSSPTCCRPARPRRPTAPRRRWMRSWRATIWPKASPPSRRNARLSSRASERSIDWPSCRRAGFASDGRGEYWRL